MGEVSEPTKSWVFVNKDLSFEENSGVEEIIGGKEEETVESDTESISIISEEGCSLKDEEEDDDFMPTSNSEENVDQENEEGAGPVEIPAKPVDSCDIDNGKIIYLATSAFCALIFIGFSIAIQRYCQEPTNVDVNSDLNQQNDFSFSYCANVDELAKKRVTKRQADNEYKSENRQNENSCKRRYNNEHYNKKVEELKIKEDYLRKKEKFLIKKEHELLKKEMKFEHKCKGEDKKKNKTITKKKSDKKFKTQSEKRNATGYWYTNLHKARNEFRQKERGSDWFFDRARLRSTRRNRAYWYFQWMFDRERLRVRSS